jgi:hypothetical protein
MNVKHLVQGELAREVEVHGENIFQCHFSSTNPTRRDLQLNSWAAAVGSQLLTAELWRGLVLVVRGVCFVEQNVVKLLRTAMNCHKIHRRGSV